MNLKSRFLTSIAMISATLVGSSFYSAPSYAQTASQGSSLVDLGVLAGVGFLSSDLGSQVIIGVDGGYKLFPSIRVGGYFNL